MSLPPVPSVSSGPSDPDDPPPPPKALLAAIRDGAVIVDEHLQIDGLDRWLVCDREMGWLLVDAPVSGHVRIDLFALNLLRRVEPTRGANTVELRGVRYAVRPVLLACAEGMHLFVGLAAS